ncbi:MAG: exopolysaccharide biosynthesis protein [Acidobacteriota bacterium]|nr:exopolysaccharide biosynthesis protein [Acidobacteriota bacterium]
MVDIHSHIVFGVDDGAGTMQESVAMLKMAAESGTTDIVATPHSDFKFLYDLPIVEERIDALRGIVKDTIRIHRGCDFHLSLNNIQACMAEPSRFTINGKRYLMVEFPDEFIPGKTSDIFEGMIDIGITPVITHPERNKLLMSDIGRLAGWVRAGCLIQVTGESFTGSFGKTASAACRKLMRHRLVHFVASDAHSVDWRPPDLRAPFACVQSEFGGECARRLFQINPAMALTGASIGYEEPEIERPWYRLA